MATASTMPIPQQNATRPTTFQPHAHGEPPDWRASRRALMLQAPNSEAAIICQLVAAWDENEQLRAELDLVRQQLSAALQTPAPRTGAGISRRPFIEAFLRAQPEPQTERQIRAGIQAPKSQSDALKGMVERGQIVRTVDGRYTLAAAPAADPPAAQTSDKPRGGRPRKASAP